MRRSIIWLTLAMLALVYSCQKEEVSYENPDPEALSPDEVEILDNLPVATGFTSTSVVMPNGETLDDYLREIDALFYDQWLRGGDPFENLGPQDARNLLIARISAVALNLTDRSKHQKPDEGPGKPAQDGIAYSWGSKNHAIRQVPPGGGTQCTHAIYGLDCSGFIYQLFTNAGVSLLPGPANSQRQPSVLQSAISSSISALDKVKVEDLGAIPTSKFETGDIIYWTNNNDYATHIGIILKDTNGKLAVFQSNGSSGNSTEDCLKNLGPTRGARRLQLDDPYWFGSGKSYGITRINADISGNWSLFLRCAGATTDAITLQLDFPTTDANSFEISGTGLDYDATPFDCSGELQYDNTTNVLSGTFFITKPSAPDFYRYDSFSAKLNRDETDYFPLTLGDNFDAGCAVEGRLKNNE
ncbi:MAG: C40 family peptidase [Lewinellaceae bacterium]|nr:C40 family peptidase [Lewinellaceae bacterium]